MQAAELLVIHEAVTPKRGALGAARDIAREYSNVSCCVPQASLDLQAITRGLSRPAPFKGEGRTVSWAYRMSLQAHIKPIVYGIFNVGVGCGIVFVNKAVLSVFNFKFVYCLTLIHTIVTMVGMWMFAAGGIFEIKKFTALQVCL